MTRKVIKPKPIPAIRVLKVFQGILIRGERLDAFVLVAATSLREAKAQAKDQLGATASPEDLQWTEIDVTGPRLLYAEVRR